MADANISVYLMSSKNSFLVSVPMPSMSALMRARNSGTSAGATSSRQMHTPSTSKELVPSTSSHRKAYPYRRRATVEVGVLLTKTT